MTFNGCQTCKHYLGGATCSAFPEAIPMIFVGGEHHDQVVEGQEGEFVYEEIESDGDD